MPRSRLTPQQQQAANAKAQQTREKRKRAQMLSRLGTEKHAPQVLCVQGEQAEATLLRILTEARPDTCVLLSGTQLLP